MKRILGLLTAILLFAIPASAFTLHWDHTRVVEENIEYFCIYEVKNGTAEQVGCVLSDKFEYDMGELTPGLYVYYATAGNAFWGESGPSNEASTPEAPSPPTNLEGRVVSVVNIIAGTVNVTTDQVTNPQKVE